MQMDLTSSQKRMVVIQLVRDRQRLLNALRASDQLAESGAALAELKVAIGRALDDFETRWLSAPTS
jgi:hypothetical protein